MESLVSDIPARDANLFFTVYVHSKQSKVSFLLTFLQTNLTSFPFYNYVVSYFLIFLKIKTNWCL
jgi:hypothetical protein